MELGRKSTGSKIYRRSGGRLHVRLHAKLATLNKTYSAILDDISRRGAMLSLDDPPKSGCEAVLKWNGNEVFGTIGWVAHKQCGMSFERELSESVLRETLSLNEDSPAPAKDQIDSNAARSWVQGGSGFD